MTARRAQCSVRLVGRRPEKKEEKEEEELGEEEEGQQGSTEGIQCLCSLLLNARGHTFERIGHVQPLRLSL